MCDQFLGQGGRLRLSLTKRCNLRCTFCHREGGHDRGRMVLDAPFFAHAANECYRLGGREVNLTGGEPTMFSGFTELVDTIRRPEDAVLNVTTNGCDIEPLMRITNKSNLTLVNVSLHGWDQEFLTTTISPKYDLAQVCDNIRTLAQHFKVCVNFSVMKDNRAQFLNVAQFAMAVGTAIKVINYQEISWNEKRTAGQYVNPCEMEGLLTEVGGELGLPLQVLPAKTGYGAYLARYRLGQSIVTVVDGAQGHKSMRACIGCPHTQICKEGFYAIRLYSDLTLAPCLHRTDLTMHYDVDRSLAENIEALLRICN